MAPSAKNQSQYVSILTIEAPDGSKQRMRLRQEEATIFGRSRGDIILPDTEISSTHCQIYYSDGHHYILDMNSTNGTYVNGVRIIKCKLRNNDIITLGQSSILFQRRKKSSTQEKVALASKKIYAKERSRITDDFVDDPTREGKAPPQIQIYALYQDGTADTLFFHQRELYIGRASSFGKFDQDDQISRKHIRIKISAQGEIFVEDQGSTNGIYINDEKATGLQQIRPSEDVVIIGNTQLKISFTAHNQAS